MKENDGALESFDQVAETERWNVGGSERVYDSPWVAVDLVDVAPPRRPAYRHHVVRVAPAVGVIVLRDDGRILLMHRHRFATDTVGFEIPAGGVDAGETVEVAARREVLEETGIQLDAVHRTYVCSPSDGMSDQRFHITLGIAGTDTGSVLDDHEAAALVWADRDTLATLIHEGRVPGALSSVAVLHALWSGVL